MHLMNLSANSNDASVRTTALRTCSTSNSHAHRFISDAVPSPCFWAAVVFSKMHMHPHSAVHWKLLQGPERPYFFINSIQVHLVLLMHKALETRDGLSFRASQWCCAEQALANYQLSECTPRRRREQHNEEEINTSKFLSPQSTVPQPLCLLTGISASLLCLIVGNCGQGAPALWPKYAHLQTIAMAPFKLHPSSQAVFTEHVWRKSLERMRASWCADLGAMAKTISVKPRN